MKEDLDSFIKRFHAFCEARERHPMTEAERNVIDAALVESGALPPRTSYAVNALKNERTAQAERDRQIELLERDYIEFWKGRDSGSMRPDVGEWAYSRGARVKDGE